jgi:RNA polymerase primary sigma factor
VLVEISVMEHPLQASPLHTAQRTMNENGELRRYLEAASRQTVPTPDDERRLAAAARAGDTDARQRLIDANMRLVVSVARGYEDRGLSLAALVRVGHLGLVRAAHRFDHSKGYRFADFAIWFIHQAITRGLAEGGHDDTP